jgi:hypothetical protein
MGSTNRRRLGIAAIAVAVALLAMPSAASAGSDQLPDLRMKAPTRFHLQTTSSGHRLLRFDTVILNDGVGPLEITGRRACSSLTTCPTMTVKQVIHQSSGGVRYVARPGKMRYAGDGHNHWHVQKIEKYELFKKDAPTTVRRGAKTGFCFFDNVAAHLGLPGAPDHPVYGQAGCGTSTTLATRVGLSVGWGDLYPWDFVYQWIDITSLPAGDYRLCVTTDLGDRYFETNDADNNVWQDMTLTAGGGSMSLGTYSWSPCSSGIPTAPTGTGDALPDSTPIGADEAGSSVCSIPEGRGPAVGAGVAAEVGRSVPDCRRAGSDGDGWLAPDPSAGAWQEASDPAVVSRASAAAVPWSGRLVPLAHMTTSCTI